MGGGGVVSGCDLIILGNVRDSLTVIPGNVPNLIGLPVGCRFAPRCVARVEHQVTQAEASHPALLPIVAGHDARCWLYHDEDGRTRPIALDQLEAPV